MTHLRNKKRNKRRLAALLTTLPSRLPIALIVTSCFALSALSNEARAEACINRDSWNCLLSKVFKNGDDDQILTTIDSLTPDDQEEWNRDKTNFLKKPEMAAQSFGKSVLLKLAAQKKCELLAVSPKNNEETKILMTGLHATCIGLTRFIHKDPCKPTPDRDLTGTDLDESICSCLKKELRPNASFQVCEELFFPRKERRKIETDCASKTSASPNPPLQNITPALESKWFDPRAGMIPLGRKYEITLLTGETFPCLAIRESSDPETQSTFLHCEERKEPILLNNISSTKVVETLSEKLVNTAKKAAKRVSQERNKK